MPDRICFVSPHVYGYFNPAYGFTGGGAERQVYHLSTALATEFDVHIVVGDYGQPQTEHREGVTLHRAYPLGKRKNLLQPAKHLVVLWNCMRRADADVYIFRGAARTAGFVYLLSRLLRRKYVFNLANDADIKERPPRLSLPIERLYELALRNANGIIAQTSYQRSLLDDTYGVDSRIVPNGYPVADSPRPHDQREFFLWVGTLDEDQKQPHRFVDFAEKLPQQRFRLVGPLDPDDGYQGRIIDRVSHLDNLELTGEIPPNEIHDEYRKAFALVNTSAYEGFPNTFLEAWRQATPVVSLNIDPRRYIDVSNQFAAGDFNRMCELARDLGSSASTRRNIGEAARTKFEENLTISKISTQYGAVLNDILK